MFKTYRKLEPDEFIVVGVDTSVGGTDYCAAQFISKTHLDVPLVYHSKLLATEMTNELYPKLKEIYNITKIKPVIAYERNNGGVFEMERLAGLNKEGSFDLFRTPQLPRIDSSEPVKYGWETNTATRPKMLQDLKECVDKHLLRIYDKMTIEEMLSFVVVQTSTAWKAQAEEGAHDDLIMSLAIAWQLYQQCETPSSEATYVPPVELLGGVGKSEGQYV